MTDAPVKDRYQTLVEQIWNDKTLGAGVRKKAKELMPELDIIDDHITPVVEPLIASFKEQSEAMKAELDALKAEAKERKESESQAKVENDMRAAIDSAQAKYTLTDEGRAKMIDRMKETKNFTDAEAAAAWVAQQTPAPKSPGPTWAPKSMDLFGTKNQDEAFKLLHRDPEAYADAELMRFSQDPDAYVRETFAA